MREKKYKVAWKREIIARDMKLDDALLFIVVRGDYSRITTVESEEV